MRPFTYIQIDADAHEEIGDNFCKQHGDDEHGIIADSEFDRLFDHLAVAFKRHGTFSEDSSVDADFNGYRYVGQHPLIQTVAGEDLNPTVAIEAALEAVSSSHRPLAASFDFHPNCLLIVAPDTVYGTFPPNQIGVNKPW